MITLVHAGISEITAEEARALYWMVLVLASIVPAFVTLLNGAARGNPVLFALSLGQGAAMLGWFRATTKVLRRRGYSNAVVIGLPIATYPFFCLVTNTLWLLGLWYIRWP